ncbi:MAG: hypothetical protein A2V70_20020 [Planctomycetes bacterium RBG_13_63_9]|nr:MAG: hypothetical protein A2V70_20020 [Planctomycetes bacterium RBG_13_63_9]
MRVWIMCFVALMMGVAPLRAGGQETRARGDSIFLEGCEVSLSSEVQLPAQEAGVLEKLLVKDGDQIKAGQLLAQIDATMANLQLNIANAELAVSKKQANNETNVKYSQAAQRVAYAEWEAAIDANKRQPNTFPKMEVQRLVLTYQRSGFEIEQAMMDLAIAKLQVNVAQAKLDAAEEGIKRRQLSWIPEMLTEGEASPEGVVQKLYRHQGEWVQQGEPVMHILRADRLWVESFLDHTLYDRSEILDRPVTVRAILAGGQAETFQGKMVLTDLMVDTKGEYKVRAEVENRKGPRGRWLLRPGLLVEMTIGLK